MIDDYSDIINLPCHKSDTYPWMSIEDRAAQFAPFAALVGFNELIKKTEIEHEKKINVKHKSEFDY